MIELDPKRLFRQLAADIPPRLHRHMFIVGSLAAAYHYRGRLRRRAVNTKDADVVVHPAGDVRSCRTMAEELIAHGWSRTDKCHASPRSAPAAELRAIRLHPASSREYFVELLGLPARGQVRPLVWAPVRLADGWYAAPCHRFMGLAAMGRMRSPEGLEYAAPAMMALANLLSHPAVAPARMSEPIMGRRILRAAKDLGRVLALAWLAGRDGTAAWLDVWTEGLRGCFPRGWRALSQRAGSGLAALLADASALEEAHLTVLTGLLQGQAVSVAHLAAVARELRADVLEPLARAARSE